MKAKTRKATATCPTCKQQVTVWLSGWVIVKRSMCKCKVTGLRVLMVPSSALIE